MKTSELRVGNYVYYPHIVDDILVGYDSVGGIFKDSILLKTNSFAFFNIDGFKPIRLDEHWLICFGFKKVMKKDNYITYKKNGIRVAVYPNFSVVRTFRKHFMHVHELQNIYYYMTGQELEYVLEYSK